jgi:hypothetical protein
METVKKPLNPNVFPTPMDTVGIFNESGQQTGCQDGMTLRDYFANSAMQTILKHKLEKGMTTEKGFAEAVITVVSYEVADAMLKQREL